MTLTLDLPSDLEARLREKAARSGVEPIEYARQVLANHLGATCGGGVLTDLFARWEAEDGTNDPGELARRNEEFARFKDAMNRNRAESEGTGARKIYP